MSRLTPELRRQQASMAAYVQWSREPDRTARTAPGRRAFLDRFQREVDQAYPDVDPKARAKMADAAMKAYFRKMAYDREKAARARKAGGGGDAAA